MIPDKRMIRYHDEIGFYELAITAKSIGYLFKKFHSERLESNVNIQHEENIENDIVLSNSFLISNDNREILAKEFHDLPNGTWMIEYEIKKPELCTRFEDIGLNGFSVEGNFSIVGEDGTKFTVREKFKRMNKLSDILPFEVWIHGGGSEEGGRKEHGEAHFELKEKKTRRSIGKIFMPTFDLWVKSDFKMKLKLMTVHSCIDISSTYKKAMVRWLELNNNENLINCHNEWNKCNEHNKRTSMI